MMDLGCEQNPTVSYTGYTRHAASFIDAKCHRLDLSLTLPGELDGKGTMFDDLRFACL